jgi:hypothetical protein
MAIFPESMMNKASSGSEFTLESIAGKLSYFHEQLQLIHWQTSSYAEHQATGGLYEYVHSFKDGVIEKLMGYMGKRPSGLKHYPVQSAAMANSVVNELCTYAYELYEWAGANNYCDVENLAQELSGEASKTKYLLTLS